MADNFVQFCFAIENITAEERRWCDQDALRDTRDMDDDETHVIIGKPSEDVPWPDFDVTYDQKANGPVALVVFSNENGNTDNAARFVQIFLAKFRPKAVVAFEACWTSSRPKVGDTGGAAFIVRADGYRSVSTTELCEYMAAELPAEKIAVAVETKALRAELEAAGRLLLAFRDGVVDDDERREAGDFILRHVPHEDGA